MAAGIFNRNIFNKAIFNTGAEATVSGGGGSISISPSRSRELDRKEEEGDLLRRMLLILLSEA